MEPPFETTDSILAATLIAFTGATLLTIDRTEPTRLIYVFLGDAVPSGLVELYQAGELRVDPVMFCLAQKFMKQRIENDHGGSYM